MFAALTTGREGILPVRLGYPVPAKRLYVSGLHQEESCSLMCCATSVRLEKLRNSHVPGSRPDDAAVS